MIIIDGPLELQEFVNLWCFLSEYMKLQLTPIPKNFIHLLEL